jgi:acid phosphatase
VSLYVLDILLHLQLLIHVPQVPLDSATYPLAPEGLELQQVHVYVRHGERTPVGVRMAKPPASIPEHWMMCKTARRFRAAVFASPPLVPNADEGGASGTFKEGTLWMRKTVERADGTTAEGEW